MAGEGRQQHEKPLKLLPLEELTAFPYSIPLRVASVLIILFLSPPQEFITVLQITLPSRSVEMTYRSENNYLTPLGAILTG